MPCGPFPGEAASFVSSYSGMAGVAPCCAGCTNQKREGDVINAFASDTPITGWQKTHFLLLALNSGMAGAITACLVQSFNLFSLSKPNLLTFCLGIPAVAVYPQVSAVVFAAYLPERWCCRVPSRTRSTAGCAGSEWCWRSWRRWRSSSPSSWGARRCPGTRAAGGRSWGGERSWSAGFPWPGFQWAHVGEFRNRAAGGRRCHVTAGSVTGPVTTVAPRRVPFPLGPPLPEPRGSTAAPGTLPSPLGRWRPDRAHPPEPLSGGEDRAVPGLQSRRADGRCGRPALSPAPNRGAARRELGVSVAPAGWGGGAEPHLSPGALRGAGL